MPIQTELRLPLSSRKYVARNEHRGNRDVPLDRHGDGLGRTHNPASITACSQPKHSTKTGQRNPGDPVGDSAKAVVFECDWRVR